MPLTSWSFILFVSAALLLYYIVPERARWVVLLAASYGFYLSGGVKMAVYLIAATLTAYAAGLILGRLNRRRAEPGSPDAAIKKRKRLTVLLALLINFGMLFALKYWPFAASAINRLAGGGLSLPAPELLLPLGVSFYIFQSAGYVIDCYRGKYAPERNPARFALFVSFFPQVIQGPISRFDQLGPQLAAPRALNADNLKYGIQLMMWGYIKKLVIADRAAVLVNTVLGDYTAYGGAIIALAMFFYCIQLYCDFSGGIDIVRGVAQMFGITLEENFRRPAFAVSLTDYWRRWHITLGKWMKDYLFYPLALSSPFLKLGRFVRRKIGGNAGKILPASLATFAVYFVIGIWHGANFRYVAFGLWNGVVITGSLLLASRYDKLRRRLGINEKSAWLRAFRIARTSLLVFIGRYITRAPRLKAAGAMLWTTVSAPRISQLADGTALSLGLSPRDILIVLLGMLLIMLAELYQEKGGRVRKALEQKPVFMQWLFMLVPLLIILLLGIARGEHISSEFIYRQF